ncbi:MAG TPA: hypothetical protein ENK92_00540 [Bacteroidetes bacterium]|uniref:Outer membrane lipoprotein carrier protein LolA n=1 Tax=candidate division TA06 bacterium TaxID=2250710 RepID=A0A660SB64_UNCT6|nr:MAG: hypothetical protein DRP44_00615 [candidate division TA06 bacterium]HHD82576.1 hypothetical protein [Bacteroidota bacterium]
MKRIILAAIAVLLMSVTTNAEQNKILSKDSVLSKFFSSVDSIRDYTVINDVKTYAGKKVQKRELKIFYKDKGHVRIDVISGDEKGGVAIYDPKTDKVRGHRGGFLKGIKLTLNKHSKLATDIRGICTDQATFQFFKKQMEKLKNSPMTIDTLGSGKVSIRVALPESLSVGKADGWKLYLGANGLPYRLEYFHGDSLVQESVFKDLNINPGLDDSVFKM